MTTFPMRAAMAAAALFALAAAPPPTGGTISIEPGQAAAPTPPAFADAVRDALAARGFTILTDRGHAAYVVELAVSRADAGTGSAKVRGGAGQVLPGVGVGMGGGVILPLGGSRTQSVALQRVQLDLWVRKRGDAAVVWHGAAVTVRAAGPGGGVDERVAASLSEAVLRGYPHVSPGVVSVP